MEGSSGALRILYSFPDTIGAPGIGTTAWNQAAGLSGLGHEVHVHATAVAREVPGAAATVTTLTVAGRRIPHRAVGRARAYRHHDGRVARALRRGAGGFDVVHCWPRATVETAAAARETGVVSVREAPNTHTAYAYERVAAETARLGLPQPEGHSHTVDARGARARGARVRGRRPRRRPLGVLAPDVRRARRARDAARAPPVRLRPRPLPGPLAERQRARGRHCGRSSSAAASRARASTTRSRAGSTRAPPTRGTFTICGDFYPGYDELLAPQLAHPSVSVKGFVPDVAAVMRESDVLLLPTRRGGERARHLRGAGLGLRPGRLRRRRGPLHAPRGRARPRGGRRRRAHRAPAAPQGRPRPARTTPRPYAGAARRAHLGAGRARPRRPLPGAAGAMSKVMIVGLDCAEPSLLFERWRSELPVLSGLMEKGAYGRLTSVIPPITVPAWSCMMASRTPGDLGVYGFRNRSDHSYDGLFIANSTAIKEPRLWDYATRAGKPSIVLGVPGTYPPRPLNGVMVSCFLTPGDREPVHVPAHAQARDRADRRRVPLRRPRLPHGGQGLPPAPGLRDDRPALPARRAPALDEAVGALRHGRDGRRPHVPRLLEA